LVCTGGHLVSLGGHRVSRGGHLVSTGGHLVSLAGHRVSSAGHCVSTGGHTVGCAVPSAVANRTGREGSPPLNTAIVDFTDRLNNSSSARALEANSEVTTNAARRIPNGLQVPLSIAVLLFPAM
jgi:hypothetical protein